MYFLIWTKLCAWCKWRWPCRFCSCQSYRVCYVVINVPGCRVSCNFPCLLAPLFLFLLPQPLVLHKSTCPSLSMLPLVTRVGGGCTWTSCAVAARGWRNNVSQRKERKWEERSVRLAGYDRRAGCVREGRGLGESWHTGKKQMKYLLKSQRTSLSIFVWWRLPWGCQIKASSF